jgi:F0F1-type ATP synthase assembly protein I
LKAAQNLKDRLDIWEKEKDEYVEKRKQEKRMQYKSDSKKAWGAFCAIIISAVIIPFLFKIDFYFLKQPVWGNITVVILYIIIGVILFWRCFLADKNVVKNGVDWILSFGFESKQSKLLNKYRDEYIEFFEKENSKPV